MKKIILLLLFFTALYSDAKVYIGSGYGYFYEQFDGDTNGQNSSNMGKLKIAYGEREAYAIEFSLDYIQNESKIFSQNDSDKYAMNIEFVKAFDFNIPVNPFFKAGFGAGFLSVERDLQKKLNYGSLNLGLGMFIPMSESFDFEVGYDYKSISYESVDTIAEKVRFSSNANIIYLGFNIRF